MTEPTRVEKTAAELIGTGNIRPDIVDDFSLAECLQLDRLVRECESCNWWVDPDEMFGDKICNECAEAHTDDC